MLRFSFSTSRPALRILHTPPQCFRSFHQTVAVRAGGVGAKGKGKNKIKNEPTFPQVVTMAERRRKKKAAKEAGEAELDARKDALPDYVREALKIPEKAKEVPKKAEDTLEEPEGPEEDGLKTLIVADDQQAVEGDDLPPPKKKRARKGAKAVALIGEDDKQAVEEADGARPKRKQVTKRVTRGPAATDQLLEELILKSPERQQNVIKCLHKGYGGDSRRKALGDVRRVNIVGEELCGRIPLYFCVAIH
jgi:hypothetical protein